MTYADTERIRYLVGNPPVEQLPDAAVLQAQDYGDSMVNTFTGFSSYTTTDPEYASVQTASEFFGAAFMFRFYVVDSAKAKEMEEMAFRICTGIRFNGKGIVVHTQSYRTYPLSETATPYRSISGNNNSVDDSDLS